MNGMPPAPRPGRQPADALETAIEDALQPGR